MLSFSGKLILNTSFWRRDGDSEKKRLEDAVREQLKFVAASFKFDPSIQKFGRFYASGTSAEVTNIRTQSGEYGFRLTVDPLRDVPASDYVSAARGRSTSAQDPAIHVSYNARLPVAACLFDPKGKLPGSFNLPADPYLAFWIVPAEERRELRFGSVKSRTNPCADNEMADLKFPGFYHYVWQPARRGQDFAGRHFRCEDWLKEGTHFYSTAASWTKTPSKSFGAPMAELLGPGSARRPVKFSVIVGALEPWTPRKDSASLATEFLISKTDLIEMAKTKLTDQGSLKDWDPAARGLLRTLTQLSSVLKAGPGTVKIENRSMVLSFNAALKRSGAPVQLRFHYGITSEDAPGGGQHWAELVRALREDDVVVYLGHSGMGRNLDPATMLLKAGRSGSLSRKPPYQLVTILGCRSFDFFGPDWARLLESGEKRTDLLLLATSENLIYVPISLLNHLDRLAAGEQPSLLDSLQPALHPRSQLIWKRLGPS